MNRELRCKYHKYGCRFTFLYDGFKNISVYMNHLNIVHCDTFWIKRGLNKEGRCSYKAHTEVLND